MKALLLIAALATNASAEIGSMTGPFASGSVSTINSLTIGVSTFVVNGGLVGIGTANPARTLSVESNGSSAYVSSMSASGGYTMQTYIDGSGAYMFAGQGNFDANSGPFIGLDGYGGNNPGTGNQLYLSGQGRGTADLAINGSGQISTMPRIIAQFAVGAGADMSTFTSTGNFIGNLPAQQTIGAGGTVAADACGGLKLIGAAGPVTTDTTNTFDAITAANRGCCMDVVNGGSNAITLDNNARFLSAGAADVVLGSGDSVRVCAGPVSSLTWYQIGPTGNN